MKLLSKILFLVLFAVFGAGIGYVLGGGLKKSPLGEQLGQPGLIDVVFMLGSIVPILAVHELGHLAGAKWQGMRFILFVAGPFQVTRTPSGLRFSLVWNLGTFGGLAAALPDQSRPIRPQLLSMITCGPLASLLLALVGGLIFAIVPGKPGLYGAYIGAVSAMIFLVTAIPSRAGGFMTDGMQFIEVWRGGQAVMHRQKITALSSQSLAGLRPRDWDSELLHDILQSCDSMQPLFQTASYHLALLAALDRGDSEAAHNYAEWLSKHTTNYPVGIRQGLTLELCLYALRSGDLKSARRWYSESKGGLVDQSRRNLVEAELANAEGRRDDVVRRIEQARTQLSKSMDAGVAVMTADDLTNLRDRIEVKTG